MIKLKYISLYILFHSVTLKQRETITERFVLLNSRYINYANINSSHLKICSGNN